MKKWLILLIVTLFLSGCGTSPTAKPEPTPQQTTVPAPQQETPATLLNKINQTPPPTQAAPAAKTTQGAKLIKGNINSKGEKIYHMPGGAYYDRTNPEAWFSTEQEAQAAGFRKSKR